MASIYLRPDGTAEGIYTDQIDYKALGEVSIARASHVEWDDETQSWGVTFVDGSEKVTGFTKRQEALDFEVAVIEGRLAGVERV